LIATESCYALHVFGTPHDRADNAAEKCMRVDPKVSGLTYKSRAKWKMLRGTRSAICGEVNVSVCVEIKGDYIEK